MGKGTHIASGYHDAVAGLDDGVQVLDSLGVLNLGDDPHVGAVLLQNLLNLPDTVRSPHKGSGDKVESLADSKENVLLILVSQGRKLDLNVGHIDALFLTQLAAIDNLTDDVRPVDLHYIQADEAVIDEDGTAYSFTADPEVIEL